MVKRDYKDFPTQYQSSLGFRSNIYSDVQNGSLTAVCFEQRVEAFNDSSL